MKEQELLQTLEDNGVQIEGNFDEYWKPAKQYVMTPDGIGRLVGIDIIHPESGTPYPEPVNVVVKGKSKMYAINDVFGATFKDFTIDNPDGFGKTKWFQFYVIQGFCLALLIAGLLTIKNAGWVALLFILLIEGVLLLGTWMNFKLKWV